MTGAHDFDVLLRDQLVQYMEKNSEQLKTIWKMERIRSDKVNRIQSEDAQLDTVSYNERDCFLVILVQHKFRNGKKCVTLLDSTILQMEK